VGGILKGVDLKREQTVTNMAEFFQAGRWKDLEAGVVLGRELAKELEVEVGDTLWVTAGLSPRTYPFKVTGLVECGVYSYDVTMGFTSLENIQEFFQIGRFCHGIGIRTNNIYESEKVAGEIRKIIPAQYTVSTWIQKNKILFAALALEKKAMAIILVLIVLVASFNIASTLMITVFRKTREIGILRALGLSSGEIGKIFFYQGLVLGGAGLTLGLSIGGVLTYLLRRYQFIRLPEFIYNLSRLPIELSLNDILLICLAVLVIVSTASIYPARRASRLNPAQALKYE
jgi:lipoprotein-releasing system permease protein